MIYRYYIYNISPCSHKSPQSTFHTWVDSFAVIAAYLKDFANSCSCNRGFSVGTTAQCCKYFVGRSDSDYSGLLPLCSEFNQKIKPGRDQNSMHQRQQVEMTTFQRAFIAVFIALEQIDRKDKYCFKVI